MAEETQTPSLEVPAAAAATGEVVITSAEEKLPVEDSALPPPAPEAEEETKKPESAEVKEASFKEESNVVVDLENPQKKALDELKQLLRAALANHEFTKSPSAAVALKEKEKPFEKAEEPAADATKASEPSAEVPKAGEPVAAALNVEESAVEAPAKVDDEPPKPEESALPAKEEPFTAAAAADEKAVVADETTVTAAVPLPPPAKKEAVPPLPPEEVTLFGVPLLSDERSDTILLKFLRARDFKPKDALALLKGAVIWRKEFHVEGLLEEDVGFPDLEKVVFTHGHDREGHPVCYNVYGELQDKVVYQKALADEEKRKMFLRWRIQFLEKEIRRELDFAPGGVSSMVQVTDVKNSPGPARWELRVATRQALAVLQDNYPEFVARQLFVNVPWWYLAFNRVVSPFLSQRSKGKFVFAGPSKSADVLFRYIAPEQVPVQYGGLSKEDDPDFSTSDAATEITIKPSAKHTVEIPVSVNSVLVWELRVVGWDVSYGAEFVPSAEDGYTVLVQKARRFTPTDEPLVKSSFKIGEPGKIVLTVDNLTSKKRKLLYRSKAKSVAESMSADQ